MIFGTWSSPDRYRAWGAWLKDPSVTSYNEWVELEEDYDTVYTGASKRLHQTFDKSHGSTSKSTRATSSRKKRKTPKKAVSDLFRCDDWNLDRGDDDDDDDDEEVFKRKNADNRSVQHPASVCAANTASTSTESAASQCLPASIPNEGSRSHDAACGMGAIQLPSQIDVTHSHEDQFEVVGDLVSVSDNVNTVRDFPRKLNSGPKDQSRVCVARLRDINPAEVYCFQTGNHDAKAFGNRSFNQLRTDWNNASQHAKDDYNSFPEIRGRGALVRESFRSRLVRCVCNDCNQGHAVHLHCKPYRFGKQQVGNSNVNLVAAR